MRKSPTRKSHPNPSGPPNDCSGCPGPGPIQARIGGGLSAEDGRDGRPCGVHKTLLPPRHLTVGVTGEIDAAARQVGDAAVNVGLVEVGLIAPTANRTGHLLAGDGHGIVREHLAGVVVMQRFAAAQCLADTTSVAPCSIPVAGVSAQV